MALLLVLAVVAPVLSSCAGKQDFRDELRGIVARTAVLARQFRYTEVHDGHTAVVTGTIQDDLRYATAYQLDGKPITDEVLVDDARALRIEDPAALQQVAPSTGIARPVLTGGNSGQAFGTAPSPSPSPSLGLPRSTPGTAAPSLKPDPAAITNLQGGGWVEDPAGAGPMQRFNPGGKVPQLGDDVVADALTVLRYVDDSAQGAQFVDRFNPEALYYRADLDPFPRPDAAVGEVRYDIVNGGLPARAGTVNTTFTQRQAALPSNAYFRALAVYVRGGLIYKILDSTSITRMLKDPNQDILARIQDLGVTVPHSVLTGSKTVQAAFIYEQLVAQQRRGNVPVLRIREMSFTLSGLGQPQTVQLPQGATQAPLRGVLVRGLLLDQA